MTSLVVHLEDRANLDTKILVTQGDQTHWGLIHYLNLPPLKAGDLLDVRATCEVRNDAGYNVEFAHGLVLSPLWCPNGVNEILGSVQLSPISGLNVDPQEHYTNPALSVTRQLAADMSSAVVQFRMRCRSTAAMGNEFCTIMQPNYGFLIVDIWR